MCLMERMADIDTGIDRMNGCDILDRKNSDVLDRMNGCDVLDGKNG